MRAPTASSFRAGPAATRTVAGLLAGASVALCAPALAQDRFYADAAVSAGVATNPFLQAGSTPAALSGTVEVTPVYTIDSPTTTLSLRGSASITGYERRYRHNDSYSVSGIGEQKLSETTSLTAEISYINSITGSSNDVVAPIAVGTGPISQLPTFIADPALSGIGRRRSSFQGLAGISTALSPYDTLSARASASASRFGSGGNSGLAVFGLDEFNSAGGGASYTRQVSRNLNVSANADIQRVDYLGGRLGDSTIIQPGVSASRTWGDGWSLTVSVSAAIVRVRDLTGVRNSTAANGSLALCGRDTRWNACITATRQTVPSSVLGVRTQTGVLGSLSYRLSDFDTLSFSGSYSRANSPLVTFATIPVAFQDATVDYYSAAVDYSHRFSARLSGFATGGVSNSSDDIVKRDANIEGRVGIRYRFGEAS